MIARLLATCCCVLVLLGTLEADEDRRAARLIGKLAGRNDSVRVRAIEQLESNRAVARHSLPALAEAAAKISASAAADDLVAPGVIRLLQFLGSFDDPLAEQVLIDSLNAEHLGISMVAAEVLGENKFHGAIDFLKKQTSRPEYASNYAFRFNLMRAFVQMEHPDAVEFVSAEARRLDGQLKYKLDQALDKVTVDLFGGDRGRFEQWCESRQCKSLLTTTAHQEAAEPESLRRIKFGQPTYYGIDIHAQRLMFILDHSGSMEEYDQGMTRLDRAKTELIRAIESLPPAAEFAILTYETDVSLWRGGLVSATPENKRRATQFVRRVGYGDKTNTHGALRRALEFDDQLEAAFLLTDGRPTIGDVVAPAKIIKDILHRNRFRHLNINTIGIAVEGVTENFLQVLAEETDGQFRAAQ